jgi:hypothetical protein
MGILEKPMLHWCIRKHEYKNTLTDPLERYQGTFYYSSARTIEVFERMPYYELVDPAGNVLNNSNIESIKITFSADTGFMPVMEIKIYRKSIWGKWRWEIIKANCLTDNLQNIVAEEYEPTPHPDNKIGGQ